MLDAVAGRYGTDPASVLGWDSFRLGLALLCLDARQAFTDRRIAQINGEKGMVFPVVSLGGMP